jgi:hypothetical protein
MSASLFSSLVKCAALCAMSINTDLFMIFLDVRE